MKKRPSMLSATFVRTVNVPGRYGDGRGGLGLSLLVRPASRGGFAKCWTQSVRIDGKPTSIGLGRYPVVTLAMARERALENARSIAQGHDPRRRSALRVPTFAKAFETVIGIHAGTWKDGGRTEHQWRASVTAYAIGDMPVNKITTADVMDVLLPIWTTTRARERGAKVPVFFRRMVTLGTETGFFVLTMKRTAEMRRMGGYDEYRQMRANAAIICARGVLLRHPHLARVVGISCEPEGQATGSEDLVYAEQTGWSDADRVDILEDCRRLGVMQSRATAQHWRVEEFPVPPT